MYSDKTLNCKDCGNDFTFTAGEQEFYAAKGFENEPARCPHCRNARKQQARKQGNGFRSRGPRQMYAVVCAQCGVETEVPFEPSGNRPVYCRDCFNASRNY
ncbi:zinc-ribbon domain containing protein [Desulfofalx alkaliphila]|uniref:zinc-ribbon domain containing protein n=1 Tax=Desulfofalx alkaliphila TaxID=105483 RepID=UPI0004E1AA66|nr:zinc-ribbon domain containing protein [Desulfofalx alkaliphila]